jgi:hypothetical protein
MAAPTMATTIGLALATEALAEASTTAAAAAAAVLALMTTLDFSRSCRGSFEQRGGVVTSCAKQVSRLLRAGLLGKKMLC